jgi:hypothetical protein
MLDRKVCREFILSQQEGLLPDRLPYIILINCWCRRWCLHGGQIQPVRSFGNLCFQRMASFATLPG